MEADDPIRFEELWEHREQIRAVCLGIVKDPVEADDLVQDTYVRALTTSHPPDRRGPIGPWLAVVARHRALDKLRSDRSVGDHPVLERTAGTGEGPVEHVLLAERRDQVRRALTELEPRDRELLVRQAVQGLSVSELADELRTSKAAVRSALWRARRRFRAAVERGGPLGTTPLSRWATPWRRLREWRERLEAAAGPMLPVVGVHLVEAMVALASVLLSTSGSPGPATLGGLVVVNDGTGVVPGSSALLSGARVEGSLEAEGLRSWAQTEVRTQTPGGRMALGTDAGEVGTDVVVEFDPTYVGVTIELDFPEPLSDASRRHSVSCDDNPPLDECPTMATLAEAAETIEQAK